MSGRGTRGAGKYRAGRGSIKWVREEVRRAPPLLPHC